MSWWRRTFQDHKNIYRFCKWSLLEWPWIWGSVIVIFSLEDKLLKWGTSGFKRKQGCFFLFMPSQLSGMCVNMHLCERGWANPIFSGMLFSVFIAFMYLMGLLFCLFIFSPHQDNCLLYFCPFLAKIKYTSLRWC